MPCNGLKRLLNGDRKNDLSEATGSKLYVDFMMTQYDQLFVPLFYEWISTFCSQLTTKNRLYSPRLY